MYKKNNTRFLLNNNISKISIILIDVFDNIEFENIIQPTIESIKLSTDKQIDITCFNTFLPTGDDSITKEFYKSLFNSIETNYNSFFVVASTATFQNEDALVNSYGNVLFSFYEEIIYLQSFTNVLLLTHPFNHYVFFEVLDFPRAKLCFRDHLWKRPNTQICKNKAIIKTPVMIYNYNDSSYFYLDEDKIKINKPQLDWVDIIKTLEL